MWHELRGQLWEQWSRTCDRNSRLCPKGQGRRVLCQQMCKFFASMGVNGGEEFFFLYTYLQYICSHCPCLLMNQLPESPGLVTVSSIYMIARHRDNFKIYNMLWPTGNVLIHSTTTTAGIERHLTLLVQVICSFLLYYNFTYRTIVPTISECIQSRGLAPWHRYCQIGLQLFKWIFISICDIPESSLSWLAENGHFCEALLE